jgi:hypothetical protein
METRFVGSAGLQVSELCWGRWPHQLIMRAHLQRQPRLVDATHGWSLAGQHRSRVQVRKPTLYRPLDSGSRVRKGNPLFKQSALFRVNAP